MKLATSSALRFGGREIALHRASLEQHVRAVARKGNRQKRRGANWIAAQREGLS
jgi:hypothetical protein